MGALEREFVQQKVVLRLTNGQQVRDWSDVAALSNSNEYGQETMSAVQEQSASVSSMSVAEFEAKQAK